MWGQVNWQFASILAFKMCVNIRWHNMTMLWLFSLQVQEFNSMSARKCQELDACLGSSNVSTYLKNQWISLGDLWSNFGRSFYHHNSKTNNKAERSTFKIITPWPQITFYIQSVTDIYDKYSLRMFKLLYSFFSQWSTSFWREGWIVGLIRFFACCAVMYKSITGKLKFFVLLCYLVKL